MWETTTVKVYQDLEIHAVFNRYLQVYRVTFVDEFDNVLSYQLIPYGQELQNQIVHSFQINHRHVNMSMSLLDGINHLALLLRIL